LSEAVFRFILQYFSGIQFIFFRSAKIERSGFSLQQHGNSLSEKTLQAGKAGFMKKNDFQQFFICKSNFYMLASASYKICILLNFFMKLLIF